MKNLAKTVVLAMSLLLSASLGFAADVKSAVPDAKGVAKATAKNSAASAKADAKATATAGKDSAKGAVAAKIVDINTATDAELKAIPGVGVAYSAKIIAGRPYANKAQLKSRNILPGNIYEQVKDLIIAKQAKK